MIMLLKKEPYFQKLKNFRYNVGILLLFCINNHKNI